ncbi:MAG: hypothetical protein NTY48_02290 [Candidatus Diapherotrites archaeon]|nr:hypothetical protein [Candidatus Diapherotrites archaeon]
MFNEFLKDAVLAISANHSLNEKISFALSPLRAQKAPDSEELMVVPVFKKSPSFSVAGVDSGFASKRLSFMELLLVKTAGVVFNFKNGSLVSSIYYPTPFSFPKPLLLRQGLERDEEAQSISLIRLKERN